MADDTNAPGSDEERARQQREEEELRRVLREKGLVQRTAFIKDPDTRKKSKGAARVAKFRERQREKGLTPAVVPATVAAAVAQAGGWTEWEAAIRASSATATPAQPAPAAPGPTVQPQRPPSLSVQDQADLDVGRRVRGLTGWRGRAVRWLLGG